VSTQVQWRARRQPSGTTDADLFDVHVTEAFNRFASKTKAQFFDVTGAKKTDYERGQRVEFEVSDDGGSTWTRRFAGFVQNNREKTSGGIDVFECDVVGYDHLLRRRGVFKTYTSMTVSAILQDLVTNFTAVNWIASNVTVQNDVTITHEFQGEKVDEAISFLASQSASEEYGVNNDFEFFFRERETTRSPSDILDGDWTDYDLPEKGMRAINQVRLFYGQSGSKASVFVEDRAAQLALQTKLNAPRRVVVGEEVTYTSISSESAAYAKAEQLLGEHSPKLSGTVTTFGRYGMSAGDVFRLQISEKNLDGSFRIAQIEHKWGPRKDETDVTITANIGNTEHRLANLSDSVNRVSNRAADPSATFTRFLELGIPLEIALTLSVTKRTVPDDAFVFGDVKGGFGEPGVGGGLLGDQRGAPQQLI